MASSPPVRLKVSYKTPESLLGELTKSVGRGGVRLETRKGVPTGTRFLFELNSPGVSDPVEVYGTVLSSSEVSPGRFVLHIRYEAPAGRKGLEAVLTRLLETSRYDKKRRSVRIPLHVRATEHRPDSPTYRLRDISGTGLGIDVEGDQVPATIRVGTACLLQMKLSTGPLAVRGRVVWVMTTREGDVPPRLGVAFDPLPPRTRERMGQLLSLQALPSPPWIARLSFGAEAEAEATG